LKALETEGNASPADNQLLQETRVFIGRDGKP
jgi:hypothetical protein